MARSGLICRWLAVVAALCLALPVAAREAHVRVQHLGVAQGLMQSSGYAMAQSPDGYLWLGTQDGLQRYDGYRFIDYYHRPGDAGSLAGGQVIAVAVGADGTVWVSTTVGGVNRLAPGSHVFEHVVHRDGQAESLASDEVLVLLPDQQGGVWIGGDGGLDLRSSDGRIEHIEVADANGAAAPSVLALMRDNRGRLWVGTAKGLLYLDNADGHLHAFGPLTGRTSAALAAIAGARINGLMQDRAGRMWVGTGRGLFVVSPEGRIESWLRHDANQVNSLASDKVKALAQDSNGSIWVAVDGRGLDRLDAVGHGWSIAHVRHDETQPDELSSDKVQSLFVDATGLVWMGTFDSGFDIYNPRSRAFGRLAPAQGKLAGLDNRIVWAIKQDRQGNVWVGGLSELLRWDARTHRLQQIPLPGVGQPAGRNVPVDYLLEDARGVLWVGAGSGLYRREHPGAPFQKIDVARPGGNKYQDWINVLRLDHEGRMWATTGWGLLQLNPDTGAVVQRFPPGTGADALTDPFVVAMCQTRDGTFWLGTSHGLRQFDGVHPRYPRIQIRGAAKDELDKGSIMACLAVPDGSLWVGTTNGLFHYWPDSGQVQAYDMADGLPGRSVFALLRDQAGDIWASSTRGLARIDHVSGKVHAYGPEDGVSNLEFAQLAAYAGSDGTLYFGGTNGITTVHPERLQAEQRPRARVAITGVVLGSGRISDVPASGQLPVAYNQGSVTFNLAVFDYASPGSNGFRYRLEGADSGWQTLHGHDSITYTNLPAGQYVLRVQGIDSTERYSLNQATLAIDVAQPPWYRWWAWTLYAVVVLLLVTGGLRLFAVWVRRQRDLGNEQYRRRSAEGLNKLIQSLSRLEDESEVATQFIGSKPIVVSHQCALLLDVTDEAWRRMAARGFGDADIEYLRAWLQGNRKWLTGLIENGSPCQLSREDLAFPADRFGDAWLALPMGSGSGKRYLLVLAREGAAFSEEEVDHAWSVARQLGMVLDRAVLVQRLKVQASTDALTRINNRRAFLQQAEVEFARSQRQLHPLAVLLIDVDHFKKVNDTHGHASGDAVLTRMVERLCNQLRVTDIIGRYGGEEFVVCLPETALPAALVLAERLRARVGESSLDTPAGPLHVTISIGVAGIVPGSEDSLSALIAKADEALYAAKRKGRNRVQGPGLDECTT